jgi:flagellar biosynthesis chaperone FliJ
MQTFRFRLEKVLEWYTRQYELEERKLTVCLAARAEAKVAIASLLAERLTIERDLLSLPAIPAPDLAALSLYRLGAKKRELELNVVRDRRSAEVEAQRVKLQAAERKVRLLEKLRERRVAEYTYAETRELEELAWDSYFAKWAAR